VARLFGTDGIRGVAGVDLTADLARSVAAAAVAELAPNRAPLVAVGRDPRESGSWLQEAIIGGLTAAGADVVLLGVVPTPAVARAVADGVPGLDRRPEFGVVISASHNPAPDNGIKLFGPGGLKLDEAGERAIEARVERVLPPAAASTVGRVVADLGAEPGWYVDAVVATEPRRLDGLRVVVDCANGAAASVAAQVYSRAGADVTAINTDLSGSRINDACGALHPESLRSAVAEHSADIGIAHDGDADRCLAMTGSGLLVDGDGIVAVLALDLHRRHALRGNAVVVTVMSNLGLTKALRPYGIDVVVTPVGDRHVAERMRADDLALGGEQSGHIVLLDHASTGDGVLTALHLMGAVVASGQSLGELAAVVDRLPQVLVNVAVADARRALAEATAAVQSAEQELGDDGRILVRASGTEPVVRVMVEAPTDAVAREVADRIASRLG